MTPISLHLNTEFLESEAVRRLVAAGRQNALISYLAIMTVIRRKGCYVEVDFRLTREVERLTGRRYGEVEGDIWYLVECGFFDKEMYACHKILTTRRLQLGYRRRRNAEPIPEEYRIKNERERRREARKARQSPLYAAAVRENKTPQEQPVAGPSCGAEPPHTPLKNGVVEKIYLEKIKV